jgi:hypothetical protein
MLYLRFDSEVAERFSSSPQGVLRTFDLDDQAMICEQSAH